jgi:sugar O-acyltransferase (sialic acid O-acetyltransferase NeuD family)
MITNLIIIGAGALGREVFSLVQDINEQEKQFEVIGFLDDGAELNSEIRGLKVLGTSQSISFFKNTQFILAIGNPKLRKQLFNKVKESGASLPNLIHPLAKIDKFFGSNWSTIEGNIICANSVLSCEVELGNNNLINVGCILSHDTQLGNHNTLMQGCIINGFVKFKDECIVSPGLILRGKHELNEADIKLSLDNY